MIYEQRTGRLYADGGELLGRGYSGFGEGKNNPEMESIRNVGCLPAGGYTVGPAYNHPKLGPVTMNLTPDAGDEMYGRDLFRIHPDSLTHPGAASDGCMVQDHAVRVAINAGADKHIRVVPQL